WRSGAVVLGASKGVAIHNSGCNSLPQTHPQSFECTSQVVAKQQLSGTLDAGTYPALHPAEPTLSPNREVAREQLIPEDHSHAFHRKEGLHADRAADRCRH